MKRRPAVLALLLLTAVCAQAQQVTPPAPAVPHAIVIPQPVERTLANGLRVIVVPKHEVPLVSARLLVRSGAEADPANLAGLAQLTANLLRQGTATRSAVQIAREVEALGASLDTGAGWDESWADITVMAPRFGRAMEYVSDVVRNPSFRKTEIERQRQQSIDTLNVDLQDPAALARFVTARVVFAGEPYGHNAGGTPSSVGRIGRGDIVAFHRRYYRPDNALLVVSGDIVPELAFSVAQTALGGWKTPAVPLPRAMAAEAKGGGPRVVVVDMPDAGQAAVVVARRGLRRADPAYLTASVANAVLGGGYSARLNEEIRVRRGLSYGAGSTFDTRRDAGPFLASTQTKNESAAEVAGVIVDEMSRLGTGDLAEAELAPRKAALIGNFSRTLETSAGLVDAVSDLALYGLSLDQINRYVGGVQSVTGEAVRTFAASALPGSSASVVIVGDAKKFLEPLRTRFKDVQVIPSAQLDLDAPELRKP